jgi:hypothetical protein
MNLGPGSERLLEIGRQFEEVGRAAALALEGLAGFTAAMEGLARAGAMDPGRARYLKRYYRRGIARLRKGRKP